MSAINNPGATDIAGTATLSEPGASTFRVRVLLVDDQLIIGEAIRRMPTQRYLSAYIRTLAK